MYESFFGFSEKPFNLTPDPKFLYLSARHTEASAHLDFGHRERGGFVVITGEVGTGKTTLARYFLGRLGEATATAVVLYPALTAAELLRSILDDLHVKVKGTSLKELVDGLHRFLLESRAAGRNVVLLIDEAQDLSTEVLEQIRLISNLETDTEKLIQIVLMGQSELQEMLGRRELRQLAQRVTARYHLSALGREETESYIRHRLRVAGGEGKAMFTPGALAAVHRLSGGLPRLVNLICDRALLGGYVHGTRSIAAELVVQAAREVRGEEGAARRRWIPYALAGALLAAVAGGAFFLLQPAAGTPPPGAARPGEQPAAVVEAAPLPPAPLPLVPLEPILLNLDRDASLRSAETEVRALWGTEPLERTPLRSHLDQVRRLDLPLVLEMFHPARGDTCFVALVGIDGDAAVIAARGGAPLRVALKDLDRLWTRQATFFWRDEDGLVGAPAARASTWTRDALVRLGYPSTGAAGGESLPRFQATWDLAPDGVLGSRTLMALYSAQDRPRPRLQRKPS